MEHAMVIVSPLRRSVRGRQPWKPFGVIDESECYNYLVYS